MAKARIQFRVVDHDDRNSADLYRDVDWPQIPRVDDFVETGVGGGELRETKVEAISWSIDGGAGVYLGQLRLAEAASLRDFVSEQTTRGWLVADA